MDWLAVLEGDGKDLVTVWVLLVPKRQLIFLLPCEAVNELTSFHDWSYMLQCLDC
jgi:hypothetical protein